MGQKKEPPKLGTHLLQWIYGEEYFDEIHGDFLELFEENLAEKNLSNAKWRYMRDALFSLRNLKLKKHPFTTFNNSFAMFENYFKITLRNIAKNKVYSTLNILGLALGIAACIFILQYVSYERSYDTFHEHYRDLYRIRYKVYRGNELNIDCAAAVPRVGPFMKEKMPEVRDYARAFPTGGVISFGDQKFREERIHIVDPSFLKIFTFPLASGDVESALTEPNTVVISESIARKYFGGQDPMGKMLRLDGEHSMAVSAVAEDVPDNSHIKFDFLISYETLNNRTRNEDGEASSETSWGWYDFNSYVLLEPNTDIENFDTRLAEVLYDERGEDFEKYNFRAEFPLQAIGDIHLYSNLLQESEPEEQGDGQAVFFLSLIAFFILLIAWINYINLSTARSIERAKEVGVRKTMGAYRNQLVSQFLAESFVLNFIAVLLALLIVIFGIRFFNQLTDSRLSLAFLSDPIFWLFFVGIFLMGSLIAGLYPAFVLSGFKPVSVLKGEKSTGKFGNQLRRGLVIFQFAASVTLIAGTIIVYQQLRHMKSLDLGFDMTETLVVKGPQVFEVDSLFGPALKAFQTDLRSQAEINDMSYSSNIPGAEIFWTNGIRRADAGEDQMKVTYIVGVDYAYFPAYNIEFITGRNYDPSFSTDEKAMILNEAAAKFIGFESAEAALNKQVLFWGEERTIIGIVDNYNQMSVKSEVAPIVFPLALEGASYFTVKLKNGNFQSAFEQVEETYTNFFPGNPFDYFFLDDYYNRQYNNEQKFSRVFTLFAAFAIFVACLGLFGLSSFSALKRTKEIGIRKVLGADEKNIVFLLSKEFLMLVLLGNLVAFPIAYFIMNSWLDNFSSRVQIGIPVFLLAGMVVLLIALLTVSYKTLRVAQSNPILALRSE